MEWPDRNSSSSQYVRVSGSGTRYGGGRSNIIVPNIRTARWQRNVTSSAENQIPFDSFGPTRPFVTKRWSDVNSPNPPPPTQHEREDLFHKALASSCTIAELETLFKILWRSEVSKCRAENSTDIDLVNQWDWKLFYQCSLCVTILDKTIFDIMKRMHAFNTLAEHEKRRSDGDMANSRCFQFCKNSTRRSLKQHALSAVHDIMTGYSPLSVAQAHFLIDNIAEILHPDMPDIIDPSSRSVVRQAFKEYSENNLKGGILKILVGSRKHSFWHALFEKHMFNGLKSRLIMEICNENRKVSNGSFVNKLCHTDKDPMMDFCNVPCFELHLVNNIRNQFLHKGMKRLSKDTIEKYRSAYHKIIQRMDYAKLYPFLQPFEGDSGSQSKIDEKIKILKSAPDKCDTFAEIMRLCESINGKIGKIENQIASEKFKIRVLEKEIEKFSPYEIPKFQFKPRSKPAIKFMRPRDRK